MDIEILLICSWWWSVCQGMVTNTLCCVCAFGAQSSQLCPSVCSRQDFSKYPDKEGVEETFPMQLLCRLMTWNVVTCEFLRSRVRDQPFCTLHLLKPPWAVLHPAGWDSWCEVILWGIVPSSGLGWNDAGRGAGEEGWNGLKACSCVRKLGVKAWDMKGGCGQMAECKKAMRCY